jgi:hypothetical protein
MVYRPVAADSCHFDQEQNPDQDLHLSEKLDPDPCPEPHLSENLDMDPDPH